MGTKSFPLAEVLSVTTGILVSDMGGIYRVLNHMTGDNLFTHQLGRAMGEAAPHILAQHPQLADVTVPAGLGPSTVDAFITEMAERFGPTVDLEPMPAEAHMHIDPLDELAMRWPDKSVIVVEVPETERGAS